MLLFVEGGKPENPAELNHQSKARTNYKLTQPEVNPGYFGGRLALSSLHHPCSLGRLGKFSKVTCKPLTLFRVCVTVSNSPNPYSPPPPPPPYCHFIPHFLLLFFTKSNCSEPNWPNFRSFVKKGKEQVPSIFLTNLPSSGWFHVFHCSDIGTQCI